MKEKLNEIFYNATKKIKRIFAKYEQIGSIDKLKNFTGILNFHDLSNLDLRDQGDLFLPHPDGPFTCDGITAWTNNVIWPPRDKMPKNFYPNKILEDNIKKEQKKSLSETGKGINIAIIDGKFDAHHPEYEKNIKYYQDSLPGFELKNNAPHWHGSMVVGHAVGKNTGIAPDANIYYFTSGKRDNQSGQELIKVLESLIEFNNKQKATDKINILSCSWTIESMAKNEEEYKKINQLLDKIKQNNIKILICHSEKNDFLPYSKETSFKQEKIRNDAIYIPTNEKTAPFIGDSYFYNKTGGDSSATPYVAGVLACALQKNKSFLTRQNWQQELDKILHETSSNKNGIHEINPSKFIERVTEITREMEMNLIKQKSIQHE